MPCLVQKENIPTRDMINFAIPCKILQNDISHNVVLVPRLRPLQLTTTDDNARLDFNANRLRRSRFYKKFPPESGSNAYIYLESIEKKTDMNQKNLILGTLNFVSLTS